jgi:hypothetical protein
MAGGTAGPAAGADSLQVMASGFAKLMGEMDDRRCWLMPYVSACTGHVLMHWLHAEVCGSWCLCCCRHTHTQQQRVPSKLTLGVSCCKCTFETVVSQVATRLVTFSMNLLIARQLSPEAYGVSGEDSSSSCCEPSLSCLQSQDRSGQAAADSVRT